MTVAGLALGLLIRKKVKKSSPVKPSANSHVVEGAVTPVELWPPSKPWKYIARSTKTGWSAVMLAAKL